jgi:hypothetical protein
MGCDNHDMTLTMTTMMNGSDPDVSDSGLTGGEPINDNVDAEDRWGHRLRYASHEEKEQEGGNFGHGG